MSNMELWNKVCETDPAHTKKVTFGRGFTAIDPMYQIMKATEQFGPAGKNWGWNIADIKFMPTDQVAILVELWFEDKENKIYQWGQCSLFTDKGKTKPDEDCMKKATTDAITKCLSYLGFNADVFLGKFDDNKYVEQMRKKKENEKKSLQSEENKKELELVKQITEYLHSLDSLDKLTAYKEQIRPQVEAMSVGNRNLVAKEFILKQKAFDEEKYNFLT